MTRSLEIPTLSKLPGLQTTLRLWLGVRVWVLGYRVRGRVGVAWIADNDQTPMIVSVHRDEEAFFVKDVNNAGSLPDAIETVTETSIPFLITVIFRHRPSKDVIRNEIVQEKRTEEVTLFCLALFRRILAK